MLDDHHSPTPRILTPRPLYNRLSSFTTYFDQPINISLPLQSEAAHNLFFGKVAPLFHSRDSSSLSPTSAGERNWDSRLLDEVWSQLTTVPSSLTVSRVPTFTYSYVPGSFAGIYEGKFVVSANSKYLASSRIQAVACSLVSYIIRRSCCRETSYGCLRKVLPLLPSTNLEDPGTSQVFFDAIVRFYPCYDKYRSTRPRISHII